MIAWGFATLVPDEKLSDDVTVARPHFGATKLGA
jgi:hypothetical protein